MDRKKLLEELESFASPYDFVIKRLLNDIPWIFHADQTSYTKWRIEASKASDINADYIYLVGSAATGFSLNPLKAGQDFRPLKTSESWPSDIDIAIVDPGLFESAWNTILSYDRTLRMREVIVKESKERPFKDRLARLRLDIYWGTLSSTFTISGTEEARRIRALLAATTRLSPFQGYQTRARIYRRREDLISYHIQSMKRLLDNLKEEG